MNVRIRPDGPAFPVMGDCFMCPRRGLQTIRIGEIVSTGGPGHDDADVPLYACRACEQGLICLRANALRNPVRPYVAAGHPH
ncbi:hypothetical protein ACFRMN_26830 [Streptomyces sp. NPDC056835]|uniref:hypothetical protein n=1 Tax=Streptomyces sp. NPDC056835 TaxID=3345956 RepID=UPI00368F243B